MKSFNHLRIGKMNEYKHEMKIREEELHKKHEDDLVENKFIVSLKHE